jgi:SAM-dependent methyltransferase
MTTPADPLLLEEQTKYRKVWSHQQYRKYSPGEQLVPVMHAAVKGDPDDQTLLDLGCGSGRASMRLYELGFRVTMADFIYDIECLDPDIKGAQEYIQLNAWGENWPDRKWDWIYCCDMLEHLPPKKVEHALVNIRDHADHAFLSIHFGDDMFGRLVGKKLHLTVRPFVWWVEKLRGHGTVRQARDMAGNGVFVIDFNH